MAAPVATGRPNPIAPPQLLSQSWRGAPAVACGQIDPRRVGLVHNHGAFGKHAGNGARHALRGESDRSDDLPAPPSSASVRRAQESGRPGGSDGVRQRVERPDDIVLRSGEDVQLAICVATTRST